jgi:toxin YhaV
MQRHGWTLLFHPCLLLQLQKLKTASERAELADPAQFAANANVKLYRTLSRLIFETVPGDPGREEYRLGNTMGPRYRHWHRAKLGRRFRLFFRYDTKARIIVFAWVNDEQTLRNAGSKSDPYAVFEKMLHQGNPPDAWALLMAACRDDPAFDAVRPQKAKDL